MATGSVKWFNDAMKFGFITADDGDEFFYHAKDLRNHNFRPLKGERVEFRPEATSTELQAREVRPV